MLSFNGKHFERSAALLNAKWYFAYTLSLRNLDEMTPEHVIAADHATVHHWLVRYSSELLDLFDHKRPVSRKRHIDKTCMKVRR